MRLIITPLKTIYPASFPVQQWKANKRTDYMTGKVNWWKEKADSTLSRHTILMPHKPI